MHQSCKTNGERSIENHYMSGLTFTHCTEGEDGEHMNTVCVIIFTDNFKKLWFSQMDIDS